MIDKPPYTLRQNPLDTQNPPSYTRTTKKEILIKKRKFLSSMVTVDDFVIKGNFIPEGLNKDETDTIRKGYAAIWFVNRVYFENTFGLRSTLEKDYFEALKNINPDNKDEVMSYVRLLIRELKESYKNLEEIKEKYRRK